MVEVKGSTDVRAADRNIAALASDGLYRTDHHLAVAQGRPHRAVTRRRSWPPMCAGWKPCAGLASWARGRRAMEGAGRPARQGRYDAQRLGGVAVG